jgi:hypothetical protein
MAARAGRLRQALPLRERDEHRGGGKNAWLSTGNVGNPERARRKPGDQAFDSP